MAWLLTSVPKWPILYPAPSSKCRWCHPPRYNAVHLLERPILRHRVQSVISSEQLQTLTDTVHVQRMKSRDDIELAVLIDVLPSRVRTILQQHPELSQLVEVVLDLGRPVLARFANTDQLLSTVPLARQELEEVTQKAGVLPPSCKTCASDSDNTSPSCCADCKESVNAGQRLWWGQPCRH